MRKQNDPVHSCSALSFTKDLNSNMRTRTAQEGGRAELTARRLLLPRRLCCLAPSLFRRRRCALRLLNRAFLRLAALLPVRWLWWAWGAQDATRWRGCPAGSQAPRPLVAERVAFLLRRSRCDQQPHRPGQTLPPPTCTGLPALSYWLTGAPPIPVGGGGREFGLGGAGASGNPAPSPRNSRRSALTLLLTSIPPYSLLSIPRISLLALTPLSSPHPFLSPFPTSPPAASPCWR
jgi:hypothetical protein